MSTRQIRWIVRSVDPTPVVIDGEAFPYLVRGQVIESGIDRGPFAWHARNLDHDRYEWEEDHDRDHRADLAGARP